MNIKLRIFVILFLFYSVGNSIAESNFSFPEDVYFQDSNTDFKILVGMEADFFINEYGVAETTKKIALIESPKYELIEMVYSIGIRAVVSTYYDRIELIEITSDRFAIKKGLKVGDDDCKITALYGDPIYISNRDSATGLKNILYENHFSEINSDGEDTYISFTVKNGIIVKITIYIAPNV